MTTETRIEYLERNIAEVRTQRRMLDNKPFGVSIHDEWERLRELERNMTVELQELRPYGVMRNVDVFIVTHKGDIIADETGDNMNFATAADAQAWINAKQEK